MMQHLQKSENFGITIKLTKTNMKIIISKKQLNTLKEEILRKDDTQEQIKGRKYPLADLYDLVKEMVDQGIDVVTIKNIVDFASKKYEPEIGEPSSVEDDDYDQRMERNYGVDDRPSDEESMWGPEEDEREDYNDRMKKGED